MRYTVVVGDNFHYQDASEHYEHGTFESVALAIAAAKRIVDEYLTSAYRPGMAPDELFKSYMAFGDDPFIIPSDEANPFSAWEYAKLRCRELCGGASEEKATSQ